LQAASAGPAEGRPDVTPLDLRAQQTLSARETMLSFSEDEVQRLGLTMDEFRLAVAQLPDESVLVEWWSAVIDAAAE
jgi:hypothetical protein